MRLEQRTILADHLLVFFTVPAHCWATANASSSPSPLDGNADPQILSLFEPPENDGAAAGVAHRASNLFLPISLLKTEAPEFVSAERNGAGCLGWQLL